MSSKPARRRQWRLGTRDSSCSARCGGSIGGHRATGVGARQPWGAWEGWGEGAVRVPGTPLTARRLDACTLTDSVVVLTPTESVSVIEARTPPSTAARGQGLPATSKVHSPRPPFTPQGLSKNARTSHLDSTHHCPRSLHVDVNSVSRRGAACDEQGAHAMPPLRSPGPFRRTPLPRYCENWPGSTKTTPVMPASTHASRTLRWAINTCACSSSRKSGSPPTLDASSASALMN